MAYPVNNNVGPYVHTCILITVSEQSVEEKKDPAMVRQ